MSKLAQVKMVGKSSDIWVLKPTKEDLVEAARYAKISLPWTYNRMAKNTGTFGRIERAVNIAKGIVAQEVLRRALAAKGIAAEVQRKSHRDEDFFDLFVGVNGVTQKLDVKSNIYYSDYANTGRKPLTPQLIIDNAAYPGPEWRRFFPMLISADQTAQGKEAYCFALADCFDFRRDTTTDRVSDVIAAFPYGEQLPFLCSKKLCLARESAGVGMSISLRWLPDAMFDPKQVHLTVVGEWDGELVEREMTLKEGVKTQVGPFSCVASFLMNGKDFRAWTTGTLKLGVAKNEFDDEVISAGKDINLPPDGEADFIKRDFCNLILPSNYTMYFIGWITKDEFLKATRQYPAWIWPIENKDENDEWTQLTEDDRKKISSAGFDDCIEQRPTRFRAGWMKMRSCCYTYPNTFRGGLQNTNMYVLPRDLHTMDTLG